ncbi:hypothetical protein [Bradyrhizobium sp. 38]|nr:hypothetical protein [Bradyrhizobium sp. 38]
MLIYESVASANSDERRQTERPSKNGRYFDLSTNKPRVNIPDK